MNQVVLFGLVVGILIAVDTPKGDAAKEELKLLEGSWLCESVYDGTEKEPTPKKELKKITLAINGDKMVQKDGEHSESGTIKIDPSQKPKKIDVTLLDGPKKGKTGLGIYRLDGDTLTMCLSVPGKDRPSDFPDKPGPGQITTVWKRAKR